MQVPSRYDFIARDSPDLTGNIMRIAEFSVKTLRIRQLGMLSERLVRSAFQVNWGRPSSGHSVRFPHRSRHTSSDKW